MIAYRKIRVIRKDGKIYVDLISKEAKSDTPHISLAFSPEYARNIAKAILKLVDKPT